MHFHTRTLFYSVKEKVDKSKMTGAGVIEPLTACEEFVSNHMYANNQCQLLGIPGGSETGEITEFVHISTVVIVQYALY